MIAAINVTKKGIYRSASGFIDALDPVVSMVTVQLIKAASGTTQRIWLPDPINVVCGIFYRGGVNTETYPATTSNANQSIGFFDGTTQGAIHSMTDPEDVGSDPDQDALKSQSNATVIRRKQTRPVSLPPTCAFEYLGKGVGYVDIRTTVDTSTELTLWVTLVAFGGSEVTSGKVFSESLGTGTSAIPVAGIGATPSLVFIGATNDSTPLADYNDVTLAATFNDEFTYGFAANIAANPQGAYAFGTEDGVSPVRSTIVISNTACLASVFNGVLNYSVSIDNWGADGFDLTPSANAGGAICQGLSVTFSDDVLVAVGDVTYPSVGDYTQTDVGFKAKFAQIIAIDGPTAYDIVAESVCGNQIAMFNDSRLIDQNMTYTTGVQSWASASISSLSNTLGYYQSATEPDAPVKIMTTTEYAMDSAGWDFTTTLNPAAEIKGAYWAIG